MKSALISLLSFLCVSTFAVPLNFNDAVEAIVRRSPEVERQLAALQSLEASYTPVGFLLWIPSLSVEGALGNRRSQGATTDTRGIEGVAALNLFRFGADMATISASRHDVESQRARLDGVTLEVEGFAVEGLIRFLVASGQREVAKLIQTSRSESLSIAKQRFQRGVLPSEEVDKVSVDLDNAAAQTRDAEAELAKAAAELKRLLGHEEVSLDWPWKELILRRAAPLRAAKAPDLSRRPDWRTAEASAERRGAEARAAFGQIFPRLDAQATLGHSRARTLGLATEGTLFTSELRLTIPLFDRLTNLSNYRAARFTEDGAQADWERVRRQALADWEASARSLVISADSAVARERTLVVSRRLYKANWQRFQRGVLSANDLRIDQDRLYQSESFVIQGWGAAHRDYVRLCHSTGVRLKGCALEK